MCKARKLDFLSDMLNYESRHIVGGFHNSIVDALIVSAAEHSGCSVLYTEDLNVAQQINGITIISLFTGGE